MVRIMYGHKGFVKKGKGIIIILVVRFSACVVLVKFPYVA